MPYSSASEVPDYVPAEKRKQWMEVFNSAYARARKKKPNAGKDKWEASAFAQANAVAGPSAKIAKHEGNVQYTDHANNPAEACRHCIWFDEESGVNCLNYLVATDDTIPEDDNHRKIISPGGWCEYFEAEAGSEEKTMKQGFSKFIPFVKVDAAKQEVWGIVTAEQPDKDREVCDYAKSKPYYQKVIMEMAKATDGKNIFPLREMHQLSAVGKGIGIEFRDADKEIFMGFKVVDAEAWKKVDEGVYTGFSQGGRIVGDLVPDPQFEGCQRYVADPSEVSLVDNPCLGVAHYAYIKADGSTEMRKIRSSFTSEQVNLQDRVKQLEAELAKAVVHRIVASTFVKILAKKEKKRSGVKYLVTEGEYGSLPYTGSDGKPDHRLMGAAWAALHGGYRGNKYEGPGKGEAVSRLKNIYEREGVDTPDAKVAAYRAVMRKAARVWVNKKLARCVELPGRMANIDNDLGILEKQALRKTLYDAGQLACYIQDMSYMIYCLTCEREQEGDESQVPNMLADNINGLMDTLLALVEEETKELKADMAERVG